MTKLPIQESIKFGWNKFWERPWFFIAVYIILGIFNANYQSSSSNSSDFHFTPAAVAMLALLFTIGVAIALISIVLRMGEKRLLLNAYENTQSATFKDLWTTHPFWRFICANLVAGIIIAFGIILLVIPGIIFSLRYMFVGFVVIDKNMRPFEALRESRRITDGHKWELLWFGLALVGVNLLGLLCLFVGLLVSVPVSAIATVYAYRFLERQASEIVPIS